MIHPVFQNLRSTLIYFGTWILITGIHFFVLLYFYFQPLLIAFADSFIFNMIFCLLGLATWYAVRYTQSGKLASITIFLNHLTIAVIILLAWFGSSYTILNSIFNSVTTYKNFLNATIPWRIISGFMFYVLLVLAYYIGIYNNNLQEKILNEGRLNEMIKDSELNLLKSQISPHFLFNSLNSVSSLTITDPEKAREMVIMLSEFLRYSVSRNKEQFSTFKYELENVHRYLDIEKVRFGSKLVYNFDVDEACMSREMPVMILQPLYENAVKHGVYESSGEIHIDTECRSAPGYIQIKITNNFEPGTPSKRGAGIGLKNIRDRLRLVYKNDQLLQTKIEGNVYIATVTIPLSNT